MHTDFFMEKILIYLIKNNKKYAVIFPDEDNLLMIKDFTKDVDDDQIIKNGSIKNSDEILERWEIKSAKVKKATKNRSQLTMTLDVECKLLIRKTETKSTTGVSATRKNMNIIN